MKIQTRRIMLRSLLGATIYAGFSSIATAVEACCSRCGCPADRCRKICRLVQEDRKITTTCWGMQGEDFCVPGPATPDCSHCETVCSPTADEKQICVRPKQIIWTSWIPGCGQEIYTKRKLMKKTVTTTVPSYKWVVETACPECIAAIEPIRIPPEATIPPVPKHPGAVLVAHHSTP